MKKKKSAKTEFNMQAEIPMFKSSLSVIIQFPCFHIFK